jgi:hypothetical protein
VGLGSVTASFANKNAGSNKAVTLSGATLTGANASKYYLNGLDGKTATITPATLTLGGVSANNKDYDGSTAATLYGTPSVSAFGSDVVSLSGVGSGHFENKNAGSNKSVTVSGYTLLGSDAGNYNLVMPTGLTADITRANLVVSGVSAANKTYDGSTAATLTGTASVTGLGADAVFVTGTGVGTFANKNAAAGKAVTVSGYTLGGSDAGNYSIVQPTGLTADISRANLAVTGVSAADKTYDGSTAAAVTGIAYVSGVGDDTVVVFGAVFGTFADKNAAVGKAVTVSGFTLGGPDAGNYNLVQPTGVTATISRADLAVTGVSANNKIYDGTTTATLSGTASVSALGSDVVFVSGAGVGSFANKNVGMGKSVTVSGFTLGGADAGNYNLVMPTGLTANITRADLAVTGVGAANKTYDGTMAATLTGTGSVTGLGTDELSVSGTGTFSDKDVGSGKSVTVSGFTLSGADAGNYNLVMPTGLTANITRADLAVTGVSAANKAYDGTTAATLTGAAMVSPFGSDVVDLAGTGTGVFADKNAGADKSVTITGYSLAGADAGNYNIVQPDGVTATIDRASLAITGLVAIGKTYDGTTEAALSGAASVTALGGDVVSVSGAGVGSFADKNAGADKAVQVAGYSLSGLDAGNYVLAQPAGLKATIARANLAVSGVTARDKLFDGSTVASVDASQAQLAGRIGSDALTLAATGVFADAAVGNNKTVQLTTSLGGADAANYLLSGQTTAVASILPAPDVPPTPPAPVDPTPPAPPVPVDPPAPVPPLPVDPPPPPPPMPPVPVDPPPPVPPPSPVPVDPVSPAPVDPASPQVRQAVAQIQSSVLSGLASSDPLLPVPPSTLRSGDAASAGESPVAAGLQIPLAGPDGRGPQLQVRGQGVRLPAGAVQ